MLKPLYDHAVLRNAKGEVVAELDFKRPHKSVWTAMAELEKSRKR